MRKIAMVVSMLCLGMWVTSSTAMDENSVKGKAARIEEREKADRQKKEKELATWKKMERLKNEQKEKNKIVIEKINADPLWAKVKNTIPEKANDKINYKFWTPRVAPLPGGMELYGKSGDKYDCIPYDSKVVGWIGEHEGWTSYEVVVPTGEKTTRVLELRDKRQGSTKKKLCTTTNAIGAGKIEEIQEREEEVKVLIEKAIMSDMVKWHEEMKEEKKRVEKQYNEMYSMHMNDVNMLTNEAQKPKRLTLKKVVYERETEEGTEIVVETQMVEEDNDEVK
ncbi:MAG: hypothetical protein LBJ16_03020 [Holosporaceae bacterium]|jgi:phosphohistidine swiveling domain-containing protein|nr:hypothetical protein [Holosporaceae bacterium]